MCQQPRAAIHPLGDAARGEKQPICVMRSHGGRSLPSMTRTWERRPSCCCGLATGDAPTSAGASPCGRFLLGLMPYSRPLHGTRRKSVETDPARIAATRPLVRPLLGSTCDLGGGLTDHVCRRADSRLSADRVRARNRRVGGTAGRPLPALRTAGGRDRRSRRPPPDHGRLQPAADGHPRNRSARRCSGRAQRRAGVRGGDPLRDALRLVRRCELRRAAADRRP